MHVCLRESLYQCILRMGERLPERGALYSDAVSVELPHPYYLLCEAILEMGRRLSQARRMCLLDLDRTTLTLYPPSPADHQPDGRFEVINGIPLSLLEIESMRVLFFHLENNKCLKRSFQDFLNQG